MKKATLQSEQQVAIEALDAKGRGIGKVIGEEELPPIEVPFTVPGDLVKVRVRRARHKKWTGELLEVTTPGAGRVVPRCIHFGSCGGCTLQQMAYEAQLKYKENFVRGCFEPFISAGVTCRPIVGSPFEWGYRNKMEYSFSMDAAGARYLGLVMAQGKRRVLNLQECHLVAPWFTETLAKVREWWEQSGVDAYHPYRNTGSLRTLTMREGKSSGDRMVMLTVSGNPDYALTKSLVNGFISSVRAASEPQGGRGRLGIFLRIQQAFPGMTTNFYEMLLYGSEYIREELAIRVPGSDKPFHLQFRFSPTAFFQPHPIQTAALYSLALELADLKPSDVVYDLYCGIGTIGICAGCIAQRIIGVDISPGSALDARLNAKLNGIKHASFYAGAVRHVMSKLQREESFAPPDVVFIDPPRAGLDPLALQALLELNSSRIVYVSCNPTTQVRDIIALATQGGYQLKTLQPIDQFPQVAHVENIALLVK